MADLLPPNSTTTERALAESIARVSEVSTPARDVWNADNCRSDLLPWLAWAFSVDEWDSGWSDTQKRAAIKSAIAVQRYKGTIGSVRDALNALGFTARVQEWFNQLPIGEPYTYRLLLEVDQVGFSPSDLAKLLKVVESAKNLRSHLSEVSPTVKSKSELFSAAATLSGSELYFTQPAGALILDGTWSLDGSHTLNGWKIS